VASPKTAVQSAVKDPRKRLLKILKLVISAIKMRWSSHKSQPQTSPTTKVAIGSAKY
jgi:hypothetical protein